MSDEINFGPSKRMPELTSETLDNGILKKLTTDGTILDIFAHCEERYMPSSLRGLQEEFTIRWAIEKLGADEFFGLTMEFNDSNVSEDDLEGLDEDISDYLVQIGEKVAETLRADEDGYDDVADFIEDKTENWTCYIDGEEYELG